MDHRTADGKRRVRRREVQCGRVTSGDETWRVGKGGLSVDKWRTDGEGCVEGLERC